MKLPKRLRKFLTFIGLAIITTLMLVIGMSKLAAQNRSPAAETPPPKTVPAAKTPPPIPTSPGAETPPPIVPPPKCKPSWLLPVSPDNANCN